MIMDDKFRDELIQHYKALQSKRAQISTKLGPSGILTNDVQETIYQYAKVRGEINGLEWVAERLGITLKEQTVSSSKESE